MPASRLDISLPFCGGLHIVLTTKIEVVNINGIKFHFCHLPPPFFLPLALALRTSGETVKKRMKPTTQDLEKDSAQVSSAL
ncbi:hypothetical protein RJ032_15980, partial [Brucella melitensis]|nr:hypothetical protein [Brucella melitensis]